MGLVQPLCVVGPLTLGMVLFSVDPLVTLRAEPRGRSSLTSRLAHFRGAGEERIAPASSQSRGLLLSEQLALPTAGNLRGN